MTSPSISTKKRLIFMLFAISFITLGLSIRLGIIQIVKGDELKKEAIEQWAKDIPIEAKRGIVYDRNMKKLITNISAYQAMAVPADIKNPERTAQVVSKVLGLDYNDIYKDITKRQSIVKIQRWISEEQADSLRRADLKGIVIVPSNKRYYPFGNFASYVLGFTDYDNKGVYGVEKSYDKYLTGTQGRLVQNTDSLGRQLPNDVEKLIEPKAGLNAVLTLDETIQHIAEKAALEALIKNKAKRVSIILMEPKTGDILAMAAKPDYDPNEPRIPTTEELKEKWLGLDGGDLVKEWTSIWKPYPINYNYEPGSTFKIITSAAGLEEKVVTPESRFVCDGFVRQVKSPKPIKCWRYYRPHGSQSFVEGVQNSCNEVFVEVGLRLGIEKMDQYLKSFGFGEKTGIDLDGEESGVLFNPAYMKEVNLATISFGQSIAVTPIQLVSAVSAVANGGNLMEPRLVSKLIDEEGNVSHEFQPVIRRNVLSKETSETMLNILNSVVSEGTGGGAYYPGYRIGGKTGTAQKVVDGRYESGKYVASFVAIAPTDDPQIVALVLIDEPSNGAYYGGVIAAPVTGQVVKETLDYLEVELKFTDEELATESKKKITVPDIRNKTIKEATKILSKLGLKYSTSTLDVNEDTVVIDQFPMANTIVNKGSMVDLYVETKRPKDNKVVVPNLKGQSRDSVIETLNTLNLRFDFSGNGFVTDQNPIPGMEVDFNSLIEVEFKEIVE